MTVPTSMTLRELLISLLSELPAAMPIELSTNEGYLYEAYLFGIVLRAARSAGFSVALMDGDRPALTLRLRGGPGRLPARRPTGTYWTNGLLSCPGRPPLEVHTAVSVVGKSRVVHEADVLVLPQADAERCRNFNLDPQGSDAELLIEAKYYSDPVGLNTGREFLGLISDVSAGNKMFVATLAGTSVINLFSGRRPVVQHDIGVLPGRNGEISLLGIIERVLRLYRSSRRLLISICVG